MPKPRSSLPNLRPEYGSADPRESQHIPFVLKLEPRPITQIKQSDRRPDTRPETFDSLLKEEACLILKQARVIHKQTERLHHQTETLHHQAETLHHQTKTLLRAGTRQMREEFYQLYGEIDAKQNTPGPSEGASFTPNSPTTPTAIKDMDFGDDRVDSGQSK
ncbi:hypothetical protein M441DRAFT_185856 [Trichoderma asperellum CBS 433.97]|uniref:Uncharacterized protein n=1 Tax=Trichoderma asperellum (strain ATCC 204424 / CBS 433.97 / NBRC 101777) TaxID=1042311 RepID=A0A2T3ZG92_TRIA4|nr:hypothetical protein M441DRAFT_185856 [Trichoderma asperellum CBS 433.97]PTB43824.1 hypothetical protein M441DRAFT_185856 [Trichoderma asperellum CBS 433.97]WVH32691.1 Snf7 [Trichoderma asperellum]